MPPVHRFPVMLRGGTGQEGVAEGRVWLHEPRVVISNPVADDPLKEKARLNESVAMLRSTVDLLLAAADMGQGDSAEVMETYRMFAHSRSWLRRMEESIDLGLSAEAAVERNKARPAPG